MTTRTGRVAASLAILLGACGDDGAGTVPDAPLAPDSAPPDQPIDADTSACTTADLSFGGSRGLVIAGDGTLYFSQGTSVGRVRPCQTPEVGWVEVGAGGLASLMVDPANRALFVASTSADMIYKIDLTVATPTASPYAAVSDPEGLTLGPDGALWSTTNNGVVRIPAANTSTPVTTSPIENPTALAFRPDGSLLVVEYGGGIHALQLANDVEIARSIFAQKESEFQGLIGIALDVNGTVYVSNAEGESLIVVVDAAGAVIDTLGGKGLGAQIDFGAGPLAHEDLYAAGVTPERVTLNVAGATVPWHAP